MNEDFEEPDIEENNEEGSNKSIQYKLNEEGISILEEIV